MHNFSRERARAIMQETKKSICIISFSPIDCDARVLRQVEYLSRDFNVTVIAHGTPPPSWEGSESIKWSSPTGAAAKDEINRGLAARVAKRSLLLTGKLLRSRYDEWYWRHAEFRAALALAIESGCAAFHANDWNALPVAAEAARRLSARLVFDAHEYAPLEFENRALWRLAYSPMITHMLRKYAPRADVSMTVAPAIADRYRQEFSIEPLVILNAPDSVSLPDKGKKDFSRVRLIHHGVANPDRRPQEMIKTVALCDERYSLHLMLICNDPAYLQHLKKMADELAPGRVSFHDPVAPVEIVRRISAYDMGFAFIAPTNYNYFVCLPNKFFDFIAAGLPVCVGPSPSMAEIVRSRGFGCVAPSFEPRVVASVLNGLSGEQLSAMTEAARAASKEITAEREMGKLVEIYKRLLS